MKKSENLTFSWHYTYNHYAYVNRGCSEAYKWRNNNYIYIRADLSCNQAKSCQNIRFHFQNKGGAKSSHLKTCRKDFVFPFKNLQDLAAHLEVGELRKNVLRVVRMTLVVYFISSVCQSIGMIGDLTCQQSVTTRSKSLSGAAPQWEHHSALVIQCLSSSKQKSALT